MKKQMSFLPQTLISEIAVSEVMACNVQTEKYGLKFTKEDVSQLLERRHKSLESYGRIEIGGGMITKLVDIFCDSPYLNAQNYKDTIAELIEAFYYFKNEALDQLGDEELLKIMRQYFDEYCRGSVELLEGSALEQMTRHIRYGEKDYTSLEVGEEMYLGEDMDD